MATKKKETKAAPKGVERIEYGEDQEVLRTSAKKFLNANFGTERVRELCAEGSGFSEKDWKEMAGLGWHGLLIPEELGGVGLGVYELGILLEEQGYSLMVAPYLSTQLAVLALNEAARAPQKKQLYPKIAEGILRPTLAVFEKDQGYDPCGGGVKAKKAGKGYSLSGTKINVLDGGSADLLLVTAQTSKGSTLFAVDARAKGVKITPNKLVDETRHTATVKLTNVSVGADALIGSEGGAAKALEKAMPRIWVALSAEMLGSARKLLHTSVEYAKVREQFGRPIGSFQGVKHRLVDRFADIENARSIVYGALWAQDHDAERALLTARMAKAYLSEVGPVMGDSAVRTHGGIGFTWECDVHLFWKRLRWGQLAFGDGPWHRSAIADMIL